MFVTVDGLDGSGKTTLVSALARRARKTGCEVSIVAFPGLTKLGRAIRSFLMDPDRERDATTEAFLLLGNFREVYLKQERACASKVLIADRFFTSTLGYQGALSGEGRAAVRSAVAIAFPKPIIDVRIVLDVPYEIGQARVALRRRKDRFDLSDREPFEKIRDEILASASRDAPTAAVIDNCGPFKQTLSLAWQIVSNNSAYPRDRKC